MRMSTPSSDDISSGSADETSTVSPAVGHGEVEAVGPVAGAVVGAVLAAAVVGVSVAGAPGAVVDVPAVVEVVVAPPDRVLLLQAATRAATPSRVRSVRLFMARIIADGSGAHRHQARNHTG